MNKLCHNIFIFVKLDNFMAMSRDIIGADLHIHSKFSSDGEFGVAEIIDKCLEKNVRFFSITDHNCVRANEKAVEIAECVGVDFVSGVEIDCVYKGINLHLLGYNINWKSSDFIRLEDDISRKVMDSFSEMIFNINRLGFVIDADSVILAAHGALPTGELIAEVMLSDEKYYSQPLLPYMKGGARGDMPYINFYLDYFAQGKAAFVPIDYMSYSDAIAMVCDNGGVPIIAHPGLNFSGKEDVVGELLDSGAAGLEIFNNYHNIDQISRFASMVQHRKKLMTCGSDFHGHNKPLIEVGIFKFDDDYKSYLTDSLRQILCGK